MKKKVVSAFLVVAMMFSMAAPAFAAPAPKPGDPMWDPDYNKGLTALVPVPSARTDASGDKIASNAQSGDYPGIYFYWDDKQKDDGVLLVREDVFTWFEDGQFYITAKNSNNYWDFWIKPGQGKLVNTDANGLKIYAYGIPKQFQVVNDKGKNAKEDLKNINMIFLNGLWRTFDINIQKVWLDNEGNVTNKPTYANATFSNGYSLGKKTVRLYANMSIDVSFKENEIVRHKFISVDVDGVVSNVNMVEFTAYEGGDYTIVFTNQCTDATVTIIKDWQGHLPKGYEYPTATFTNGYAIGKVYVPAGKVVAFTENPINSIVIGDYSYSFELVGITINGDDCSEVNFAAEANEDYVVVFTNAINKDPLPATVTAKKVWDFNDIFEELPEGAVATFSNGFELDVAKQVDAWSQVSFEENSAWSAEMIFDDGILYRVWYELVGVTINGQSVNTINFKAHANREYIVEFTNKFFKEKALDDPTYTVDKVWLDENGAPISFALVNSRTGGASVTFSSSIDGVIQLNTVYTVDPFTTVEITEGDVALYHGYTIDGVYYPDAKFVLDYAIHTVDGVDYAGAEFVAEDGMDYVVTLYNKLVLGDPYVPPTILITEKIPSTEHFDLWWQYGVLCYSSNTTPNGEYFIGFAPDFWDKYDKATIGFGVANDIEFTAIFTKDSTNVGGYVFYAIPADWTPHYSNGVGFVGEEIRGVWFDNPFGTGSRQAYFLEIVLKP